jgi:hypothetical protein
MLASAQAIDGVAALISSVTGMTGKVHTSRAWPLAESDLPAWRVLADDEEVTAQGVGFPAKQQHDLTVIAHGYARETADLDDALHGMGAAALTKLFASRAATTLSPLNCSVSLKRIERDLVNEGEAAMGRISLTLLVRFLTSNNAPETIL